MVIELFQGKHNLWASRVALAVKNLPASGGDIRDIGSTSGSGRVPEGEHATHSSFFYWRIPWTEEPGRFMSHKESGHE